MRRPPPIIHADFSPNPWINYCITRVLGLPLANRKLDKYQALMQDKISVLGDLKSRKRELEIYINIILEDLAINWQLIDPAQDLKSVQQNLKPVLLVSNHPLGGRDGMVMLACGNQIFGPEHFKVLANEFLLQLPYLQDLFLAINPFEKGIRHMRILSQTLREEKCKALLLFPAGLCSRRHPQQLSLRDELEQYGKLSHSKGILDLPHWAPLEPLRDLAWHRSFLRLARKHRLDILPLHISGSNSGHFYRLARLRKKLGLRFNWEMLLLPREFLYSRCGEEGKRDLRITVGNLLRFEQIILWPQQHDELWAQLCKHYVYQLPHLGTERAGREIEQLHQAILETQSGGSEP